MRRNSFHVNWLAVVMTHRPSYTVYSSVVCLRSSGIAGLRSFLDAFALEYPYSKTSWKEGNTCTFEPRTSRKIKFRGRTFTTCLYDNSFAKEEEKFSNTVSFSSRCTSVLQKKTTLDLKRETVTANVTDAVEEMTHLNEKWGPNLSILTPRKAEKYPPSFDTKV